MYLMRPDIAYVGALSRHIACPAKSQAVKSVFRYLRQYKLTFQAENSVPEKFQIGNIYK